MLEFTSTVHGTILPVSNINVSSFLYSGLILGFFWPNKVTITVFNSVYKSTAVLRAILENHVSVTCFLVEQPVTSISTAAVWIDLDTEAMADRLKFIFKIFCNECNIFYK
jgi:hypothetical protein